MIRYLSLEQVLSLHQGLVGHLSEVGVRDLRGLEAAVLRPTLTFEGEDLYPTLESKAAALIHALALAAPFVRAGRETAILAGECFLAANGARLHASDKDLERLAASIATGEAGTEALAVWIRQRAHPGLPAR
jgi:death on curing protein